MICQLCPECAVDEGEPCRRRKRPPEPVPDSPLRLPVVPAIPDRTTPQG